MQRYDVNLFALNKYLDWNFAMLWVHKPIHKHTLGNTEIHCSLWGQLLSSWMGDNSFHDNAALQVHQCQLG